MPVTEPDIDTGKRHTLEASPYARKAFKIMAARLDMTMKEFTDWLAPRAEREFDRWQSEDKPTTTDTTDSDQGQRE